MNTIIEQGKEAVISAAKHLRNGDVVAVPTETVYGLAANAFDKKAIEKIFVAKNRPQDNPLIVHICDVGMLPQICVDVPQLAYTLANVFWPGPLTLVLKKSEMVPDVTSGGLDTVGVRIPDNEITLDIIRQAGFPIAAPSANLSGKPSPTNAQHVFDDMNGKIPLIVDGGECRVGVESTVVCFEDKGVRILRPGAVTAEMLSLYCDVVIDESATKQIDSDTKVKSPGMKYKHYSPKTKVVLVEGSESAFLKFVREKKNEQFCAFTKGEMTQEGLILFSYGKDENEQAKQIFKLLRQADEQHFDKIYIHAPDKKGLAFAVYNRLVRAAGFDIVNLEE